MSQFYARYIPGTTSQTKIKPNNNQSPKRKRNEEPNEIPTTPSAKRKKERKLSSGNDDKSSKEWSGQTAKSNEGNILKRYSISAFAEEHGAQHVRRRNHAKKDHTAHPNTTTTENEAENANRRDEVPAAAPEAEKHAHILSKFKKSRIKSTHSTNVVGHSDEAVTAVEDVEKHGLEPIPQPISVNGTVIRPAFSTNPTWQTDGIKANEQLVVPFDSMGLSGETLKSLNKHGMQNAFPIQSAVIPFLREHYQSAHDICISAATGSGKTLAYVIPIIEALRKCRIRKLRAVIVVPTRELVKQVRESCEICATGSDLRIAIAVGSRSLKQEQEALVQQEQVYDPVEYQRQCSLPIDWSKIDLSAELEMGKQAGSRHTPNFVTRYRTKADILITTPGRLVDHLKNTEGFNLDDTEWLVVDEADRLLNESYQEWIEVVVPALQARNATDERDKILASMRIDIPPRIVRKILLSATMTRDISKLNALGLNDPKLIVLGSTLRDNTEPIVPHGFEETEADIRQQTGDGYLVPPTLSEMVLAIKDAEEKPLAFLHWLRAHIDDPKAPFAINRKLQGVKHAVRDTESSSTSDSEDTSSDGSSTDSSSDSSSNSSETTSIVSTSSEETSSDESDDSQDEEAVLPEKRLPLRSLKTSKTVARALIFVKSTAAASRLSRLLILVDPSLKPILGTLTRGTASSASSRKALAAFRSKAIRVLIATDRASRGIDVTGLEHVVNYDVPGSALTYVHRVGRTARAGLSGHAWTFVEHHEGRWFWNEIGGKGDSCHVQRSGTIQKMTAQAEDDTLKEQYQQALQILGQEVRGQ